MGQEDVGEKSVMSSSSTMCGLCGVWWFHAKTRCERRELPSPSRHHHIKNRGAEEVEDLHSQAITNAPRKQAYNRPDHTYHDDTLVLVA